MKRILMITHSAMKVGGGEEDFERLLNYLHGKYSIYTVAPLGFRLQDIKSKSQVVRVVPNRIFPFTNFSIIHYFLYLLVSIQKLFLLLPFLLKHRKSFDASFVNSSACIVEIFLLLICLDWLSYRMN